MNLETDICVIGAGSGGLSVAVVAVQLGARVTLIEQGKMGGDCLNYGCVPSKALLATSKLAMQINHALDLGISAKINHIDYAKVQAHVQQVIQQIAPNDSVERFENLGVNVIKATAQFENNQIVVAGNDRIKAKYFVIAAGSRAFIPPINGLHDVPYLTNETIFDLTDKPQRLIIIGGGPIGCEMAQAHAAINIPVTLLARHQILPRDDEELVAILRNEFLDNQIDLRENTHIVSVEKTTQGICVNYQQDNQTLQIEGSHLLIAVGRRPNVSQLDLSKAKVNYTERGISVDKRLRTSNKHIFAVGDVIGEQQFTHLASYHAGIVIRNMLFRLPATVNLTSLPWVTYTHPELAHVGLSEKQAGESTKKFRVIKFNFKDNDRAQTENVATGFIKLVVDSKKQTVLGVSIIGPHAGELIGLWVLSIQQKIKLSAIAAMIMPYPTLSEISKRAAGEYYAPALYSRLVKKIVRFLLRF